MASDAGCHYVHSVVANKVSASAPVVTGSLHRVRVQTTAGSPATGHTEKICS
jgi:hypothetical protein